MGLKRREFTREFKLGVICEIAAGKSLAQVARKYQLDPSLICRWRKFYERHKDEAFAGRGRAYSEDARIAEIERLIGVHCNSVDYRQVAESCIDLPGRPHVSYFESA